MVAAHTAESGKTKTHTLAKFVGHSGTRRVISKADQDNLVGVKGVATQDLVWEPGNKKVDVTDVHEDVIAYMKEDGRFRFSTVDAPASA